MAIPVLMPRQGQSVESCIMGRWYKSVGEEVHEGDLLFSYETDKSSFEEEAKTNGILLAVFYDEGDEVPVLSNVAVIGEKDEKADTFAPALSSKDNQEAAMPYSLKEENVEESPTVIEFDVEQDEPERRIRISPLAKKMAEQLGLQVKLVKGSGPHGRIIARDIKAAGLASGKSLTEQKSGSVQPVIKPAAENEFEIKPIPNIRKLIARAMYTSLQNSAQLTHHLSADARKLLKLRKKFKQAYAEDSHTQNVTINDLVCFAVIRALLKFPQVNSHYLEDKIKLFKKVHLGLAVDTQRGLMVPSLKNADDLSVTGLSFQLQQLATQARSGNINPDLLNPETASFTISNLGNYGVEIFTPVINLPQTAILGVCSIIPRPMEIEEGVYAFVPMIGLSLTYDHRALDGGEATRFLAEIKEQIESLSI